ncbi:hypothetical protein RHMOL_Rhmol04G0074200 [Rhododendron molle]|uniref:Uncharacterized protein n=1 Tax=Rhododendron molle TaxID=49168 RepID=A0ACC0NZA0_RHOML|nr:hypothetical protein RHMOL_Rhmol04G0074200 [Rhododendron molle]
MFVKESKDSEVTQLDPEACPKRRQPEVVILHSSYQHPLPKPSRVRTRQVFSNRRVTDHSPHAYVDLGSFRDVVTADLDVGTSLVGKHQWAWRV